MVIKRTTSKPEARNLADCNRTSKNEQVVHDYMVKLAKTIKEKDLDAFWTFADRSGFKKIKNMTFNEMRDAMKEDIETYKNRQLVHIKINTHIPSNQHGTHLFVNILVIFTDNEANIKGRSVRTNSCTMIWNTDDFKFTKFSLKLVEEIIEPIAEQIHSCGSFTGFSIKYVVDSLKKKKVFLKHISPLAGLL